VENVLLDHVPGLTNLLKQKKKFTVSNGTLVSHTVLIFHLLTKMMHVEDVE